MLHTTEHTVNNFHQNYGWYVVEASNLCVDKDVIMYAIMLLCVINGVTSVDCHLTTTTVLGYQNFAALFSTGCNGKPCPPFVNSTKLLVDTFNTSACATVHVKCPSNGQALANLIDAYTCYNGRWFPYAPLPCVGEWVRATCEINTYWGHKRVTDPVVVGSLNQKWVHFIFCLNMCCS